MGTVRQKLFYKYESADFFGLDEVLDLLLDQEGLEIDELDRLEKDTPLHKAVRYANSLSQPDWEVGQQIADILVDAGCDPRYEMPLFYDHHYHLS
jgi:hypothetical protein